MAPKFRTMVATKRAACYYPYMRPARTLELHRHDLRELAREKGLTRIRVFGSTARGDDRDDSDLDLLVCVDRPENFFPAMGFILEAQRRFPDAKIDAITDLMARPEILSAALSEGFLL